MIRRSTAVAPTRSPVCERSYGGGKASGRHGNRLSRCARLRCNRRRFVASRQANRNGLNGVESVGFVAPVTSAVTKAAVSGASRIPFRPWPQL